MQDERHNNNACRKGRLKTKPTPCRTGNIVDLNNHRVATASRTGLNNRRLYEDLSSLLVDMARLRSEVQTTMDRLITICSSIDNDA